MERKPDEEAQRERRKAAVQSAVVSTVWMLLTGLGLLALRWYYRVEGLGGAALGIMALLDLGMIVPVWILLKTRLKEIEGGEEDAASEY